MTTAIRGIVTGLVGLLVIAGLVPEGAAEAVTEHATAVIGGILLLWSSFAIARARKEASTGGEK